MTRRRKNSRQKDKRRAARRNATRGSPVNLNMTPDDVFGLMHEMARRWTPPDAGEEGKAAFAIGILTVAKLTLRPPAGQFPPDSWEILEQQSDDLAVRYDIGPAAVHPAPLPPARTPVGRPYLHLVRNRTVAGRWSTASVDEHGPTPEMMTPRAYALADDLTWKVIAGLARVRKALVTASPEQRERYEIAEAIAVMGFAKLQLAAWGNGPLAAAFEYFAQRGAEHAATEYTKPAPRF